MGLRCCPNSSALPVSARPIGFNVRKRSSPRFPIGIRDRWRKSSRKRKPTTDLEEAINDEKFRPFNGSPRGRSEEHTSELQSLMRTSYAVFCLKKKNTEDTPTKLPTH